MLDTPVVTFVWLCRCSFPSSTRQLNAIADLDRMLTKGMVNIKWIAADTNGVAPANYVVRMRSLRWKRGGRVHAPRGIGVVLIVLRLAQISTVDVEADAVGNSIRCVCVSVFCAPLLWAFVPLTRVCVPPCLTVPVDVCLWPGRTHKCSGTGRWGSTAWRCCTTGSRL